jgi:hypothetical protein
LPFSLLLLLALIVWRITKRHPHMWDEAPADDAVPPRTTSRSRTLGLVIARAVNVFS